MATSQEQSGPDPENCFKILLATDIHLGYKEKDEIIGGFTDLVRNFFLNCERKSFVQKYGMSIMFQYDGRTFTHIFMGLQRYTKSQNVNKILNIFF